MENPGGQKLYLFLKDTESSSPVYSIVLEGSVSGGCDGFRQCTVSFDGASRELTLVYDTDVTRVGFKLLLPESTEGAENTLHLIYSYVNVLGEEKQIEKTADNNYSWICQDF